MFLYLPNKNVYCFGTYLIKMYFCFCREEIECREPIEVVSYKIGVCRVSPRGKECATTFKRLGYNGCTSVVLCRPRTGRMHQIRVHLQYLGEYHRYRHTECATTFKRLVYNCCTSVVLNLWIIFHHNLRSFFTKPHIKKSRF